MTEWAGWEECDNPCGIGSRRRIRKVDAYPENGGKHCPVLKQRQACVGDGLSEECLQQDLEFQGEELRGKWIMTSGFKNLFVCVRWFISVCRDNQYPCADGTWACVTASASCNIASDPYLLVNHLGFFHVIIQ